MASSSAVLRVTLSVPSSPTTDVTPARVKRERGTGGTRVCGPRLAAAAAAVDVRVRVDEPRHDACPAQVALDDSERARQARTLRPDPSDSAAGHQEVTAAERLGGEDLGVGEELQKGGAHATQPAGWLAAREDASPPGTASVSET